MVSGHREDFEGLRLTCRQLNAEYNAKAQGMCVLTQLLEQVHQDWPHAAKLRLPDAATLLMGRDLKIELPLSLYFKEYEDDKLETKMEQCLAPLIRLHLKRTIIAFYEDEGFDMATYSSLHAPAGLYRDCINLLVFPQPEYFDHSFWKPVYFDREFVLGQPLYTKLLRMEWLECPLIDYTMTLQHSLLAALNDWWGSQDVCRYETWFSYNHYEFNMKIRPWTASTTPHNNSMVHGNRNAEKMVYIQIGKISYRLAPYPN
jgi:hypothetical protein